MQVDKKDFNTLWIPYFFLLFILIYCNVWAQGIEHPEWGFKDFPADSIFHVENLTYNNIQNAINQASNIGGGTVLLSSGTVKITQRITMKSNVKLVGELNTDSTRAVTIVAQQELSEGLIYAHTETHNTTVENLIIDGSGFDHHGIAYVYGPDNFLISNCEIKNLGFVKIDTSETVTNSGRADNPSGITIWSDKSSADHFTIRNNVIMNYCRHGVVVNNGENFIIQDNFIENGSMGYDAEGSNGEILGNEIVDCLFGAKLPGSNNLILHNNNHHNLDDTPYYDPGYGINDWSYDSGTALVFQGDVKNIVVKNNILSGTTEDKALAFWGANESDVTLINNDYTPSGGHVGTQAPVITTQPKDQVKIVGQTATLAIEAIGDSLSYQWYCNGVVINGATDDSYITPPLELSNNGDQYYCVVTNPKGSVSSITVTITVFEKIVTGGITIDGNFDDWHPSMQFDIPPNETEEAGDYSLNDSLDLKDIYVTYDDSMLYIRVDINDKGDVRTLKDRVLDADGNKALIQIGLDTDLSAETGLTYGIWATGADYYLNITDPVGNYELQPKYPYGLLDCNTDWPWSTVEGESCRVAVDPIYGTRIEAAIPRQAIGETGADSVESTAIIVWAEDPRDWGNYDGAPDNYRSVRNVYNYARGIGDLTSVKKVSPFQPVEFSLEQNYPNPFNPMTTIRYSINQTQHIDISVYDILGHKVMTLCNKLQAAGQHLVVWNGKNLAGVNVSSGIYFYCLKGEKNRIIKKMVLAR